MKRQYQAKKMLAPIGKLAFLADSLKLE